MKYIAIVVLKRINSYYTIKHKICNSIEECRNYINEIKSGINKNEYYLVTTQIDYLRDAK